MGRKKTDRATLTEAIAVELGREISARTLLFHQAVAERVGLSITDHKCLDLAQRAGGGAPVTAGQLAELTGLTTGAITGVLDRLEEAGFVRREKHPDDRRQVLVKILPAAEHELAPLFEPLKKAWLELCARYDDEQLEVIAGFTREVAKMMAEQTDRLKGEAHVRREATSAAAGELSAPRGRLEAARLEIAKGASGLTLLAGDDDALLYRGRFDGPPPRVELREGVLSLHPPKGKLLDFARRSGGELRLSPRVRWALAVSGGASKLRADLRLLDLSSMEITGGASDVFVELPEPSGAVAVTVRGGASNVKIVRPSGVATKVSVGSGASDLQIDSLQLGAVGGQTRWESPDFSAARDRYVIEVHGGASALSILASPAR